MSEQAFDLYPDTGQGYVNYQFTNVYCAFQSLDNFNLQFVLKLQITDIAVLDSQFLATASEDGIVWVWSVEDREPTLQFQVMGQVKILNA